MFVLILHSTKNAKSLELRCLDCSKPGYNCIMATRARLPLIDVFTLNDELPMMRYRLQLHASIADRTLILESRFTHGGQPKPLHARESLTPEQLRQFNVVLLEVPFPPDVVHAAALKDVSAWSLEERQRKFVNAQLPTHVREVSAAHGGSDVLVHVSDADELLDPEFVKHGEHSRLEPSAGLGHRRACFAVWQHVWSAASLRG